MTLHRVLLFFMLIGSVPLNGGCAAQSKGPGLTVTRHWEGGGWDSEPLVANVPINFTYDPFFTDGVWIARVERTNFDGRSPRLLGNAVLVKAIARLELGSSTSGQGKTSVPVPRGAQVAIRLSTLGVDGQLMRAPGNKLVEAGLPQPDPMPVGISQTVEGFPVMSWVDPPQTRPTNLRWAIRSWMHPYPDRWQPGESLAGLESWLLGAPRTEILVWRESDPNDAKYMVVDPYLAPFSDTISGALNPEKGSVRLSGWQAAKWKNCTLCVFDLAGRTDSSVASGPGGAGALEFRGTPTAAGGLYAIAARDNASHVWTRLSNVVDLRTPQAPGEIYLLITTGGGPMIHVRWSDDSDNEEFFELERASWKDEKKAGPWEAIGAEFHGQVRKDAYRPKRAVYDNQWHDPFAWGAFDGYALQYRVRAARVNGGEVLASEWKYSDLLIRRTANPGQ